MLVRMDQRGRLTIPNEIREVLGLEGKVQFEVEMRNDALILHRMSEALADDAWAYRPEHLRAVAGAGRETGGRHLTETDLIRLTSDTGPNEA
jgi:bifunctional DNA-binding transcriptional regulator/antitoxin component of YhaV-PrlF toxin-antitoxin module